MNMKGIMTLIRRYPSFFMRTVNFRAFKIDERRGVNTLKIF